MPPLIAAFVVQSSTHAQNIGWHPSSPIYLGANLDPDDPRAVKVPCLKDPIRSAVPVDSGTPSTEFRSTLVRERRDLYNAFSVSASFSASFGIGGGGGSVSSISEVTFDSETVVWSLQAKTNYGRTAITNVEFKEAFANLPPANLQSICGTHYVVMDRREAVVAAVFMFRSSSQKTRDDLKAALSANWVGGNFSTNLSNVLQKAISRTEVSFVFLAKGGDGLSGTSGFVTSFDKIDDLRKQIANYIGKINRENAPAAEYFIAKLPIVPDVRLLLDARERALANAWNDYLIYDQILTEARKDLNQIERFWYLDPTVLRNYLTATAQQASQKIAAITASVTECLNDKSRCVYTPDIAIPIVDWPAIDPVNNGGGHSCVRNDCNGTAQFLLRVRGPGKPGSIKVDRIGLTFPGGTMGYNCRYRDAPTVSEEGVQFKCSIGYDTRSLNKASLDLRIFDLVTGVTALRIPFVDAAPDFPWPN